MWWQQQPSTREGTATNVTLASGVQDVEKGNVYSVPAGAPLSIPIPARVIWEDSQHVVLQTIQGIISFLHVNPTVAVGTVVPSGTTFGDVSYIGSSGHPSSYFDSASGMTYVESGNIIEFGFYDTAQRAKQRDNYVNGVDQPFDFTGIFNPNIITSKWSAGITPQKLPSPNDPNAQISPSGYAPTGTTTSLMGMSPFVLIAIALVAIIVLRKIR